MAREIQNIDVSAYSSGSSYEKYDLVYENSGDESQYFISAVDNNVGQLDTSSYTSNAYWKRIGDTGSWSFNDIWTPSYSTAMDIQAKSYQVRFGDGYDQRVSDDIFFLKQDFQGFFQKMTDKEAKSLLAFLEYHGGEIAFPFKLLDGFETRNFTFDSFKHIFEGYNTHTVNIIFAEV